jgi:hypothetical protein
LSSPTGQPVTYSCSRSHLVLVDVGHITADERVEDLSSLLTEHNLGHVDDAETAAARAADLANRVPRTGETG